MKQVLLFIVVLLNVISLMAQTPLPGGVRGVSIWEKTQLNGNGEATWKSTLKNANDTIRAVTGKSATVNFNPALTIDTQTKGIEQSLNLNSLKCFSLFSVCQPRDTIREQVIFSLENDTATEMVLTCDRLAALDAYRYASFSNQEKNFPRIYSYAQNKTKDTVTNVRRLRFGQTPRLGGLPVAAYTGIMPEVLVFGRYLSFKERQQVESYLALKYGISLDQTIAVSYLDSRGEVIWDADQNARYGKNIAGVGRDDPSGLLQPLSQSAQAPGVMRIGASDCIADHTFCVWGDNGGVLRFAQSKDKLRPLGRGWKIQTTKGAAISLFAETETLSLSDIDLLLPNEIYWMMLDNSGIGNYPFGKTRYIACSPMTSTRGTIHFSDFIQKSDTTTSKVFTLVAAPSFFTRSQTISSSCLTNQGGTIQTDIVGGTSPFTLSLRGGPLSNVLKTANEVASVHEFKDVEQGIYTLTVSDARGSSYNEKIIVSNDHPWDSPVESSYSNIQGETASLDASIGMPSGDFSYKWTLPDGSVTQGAIVNMKDAGGYMLSITDGAGCNYTMETTVTQTQKSNFKKAELYPNPTGNGRFTLRVSLLHAANVDLTISNVSGRIVKQSKLQGDLFYWYTDTLNEKGIYLISLSSEGSTQTLKLIVQ